ncbi:MAG: hypothetical protein ACREJY_08055 [Candidatus Rokuibacteriota bacterium]
MISFNPSAGTPLLLLMGVVSHSICPECHDGVRKELDRWRTRA